MKKINYKFIFIFKTGINFSIKIDGKISKKLRKKVNEIL